MNEMTVEKLCEHIGLPLGAVEKGRVSQDEETRLRKLFDEEESLFYQTLKKEKNPYPKVLYLYMKWAAEAWPAYRKAGVPEQIYYDSFRDMEIWYRQCLKETGIPGMKQWEWTSLPIKMKIFRLGRLQYEPSVLRDESWNGGAPVPVLEVHIPAGEPLDIQAVRESFAQAERFFRETVIWESEGFHCVSWLLSPRLKELLSDDTNIIKFQNLFRIYKEIPARQAEERVFGSISDKTEEYPEDTSLQRALKKFLLEGNRIGMGCGMIEASSFSRTFPSFSP